MRFKRALLATALVSVLASVALPAAVARADSSVPLPFPQLAGFHQILADDAAGYVFISEGTVADYGPGAGGIVVTDLSGRYVTTLDTGDDAKGLALSPDGKTLYAALAATNAVGVIDTATLTQTTTYPLATAGTAPYSLALQSGKLWVSYDVAASGLAPKHGAIGDFDLSAANPAFDTQPVMDGASAEYFAWWSAPNIAADPANTGVLVAVNGGVPLVVSYKVAADPVTKLSWGAGAGVCAPAPGSLAVLPGGSQLLMCGTINLTADLGGYDRPPTESPDITAALRPDALTPNAGLLAVASYTRGASHANVSQLSNGSSTYPTTFSFASPDILAAGGLAFGASGSRLYVMLENFAGTAFKLQVIDNPAATTFQAHAERPRDRRRRQPLHGQRQPVAQHRLPGGRDTGHRHPHQNRVARRPVRGDHRRARPLHAGRQARDGGRLHLLGDVRGLRARRGGVHRDRRRARRARSP